MLWWLLSGIVILLIAYIALSIGHLRYRRTMRLLLSSQRESAHTSGKFASAVAASASRRRSDIDGLRRQQREIEERYREQQQTLNEIGYDTQLAMACMQHLQVMLSQKQPHNPELRRCIDRYHQAITNLFSDIQQLAEHDSRREHTNNVPEFFNDVMTLISQQCSQFDNNFNLAFEFDVPTEAIFNRRRLRLALVKILQHCGECARGGTIATHIYVNHEDYQRCWLQVIIRDTSLGNSAESLLVHLEKQHYFGQVLQGHLNQLDGNIICCRDGAIALNIPIRHANLKPRTHFHYSLDQLLEQRNIYIQADELTFDLMRDQLEPCGGDCHQLTTLDELKERVRAPC